MAIDAYNPCPCGSGKKFKWCCQPIHGEIDMAFQQNADGQHEAALRTMANVVAAHPANPEVYGRQAQLFTTQGKIEDAEAALEKAFAINPNYPFGYLLRGTFRQQEGEISGALLLFRRAADLYDPAAHEQLALIQDLIGDLELKRNNPVAARAALMRAVHLSPANEDLRRGVEFMFGEQSRLPQAARKDYAFRGLAADATPESRQAWQQALAAAGTGRLSDARRAFETLTQAPDAPSAAWFNLGLTLAWLGENPKAIEALSVAIEREADEALVAEMGALSQVLSCGYGLEQQADFREHFVVARYNRTEPLVAFLRKLKQNHRLLVIDSSPEEGLVRAIMLEGATAQLAVVGVVNPTARAVAHLLIMPGILRLSHPNVDSVGRVAEELRQELGPVLAEVVTGVGPISFGDVVLEALVFPVSPNTTALEMQTRLHEHAQRYFEETWIHEPLKSLGGVPPVDAVGHPVLRKKLLGNIQFLEECLSSTAPRLPDDPAVAAYDFDRLRRRLGLAASPTATEATDGPDFDAMSVAELAEHAIATLSDLQLEDAMRAALKLDAKEIAARFAKALVARPVNSERPDRYPAYQFLVQAALAEGDTSAALTRLEEATDADAESNEGRRRSDYDLMRARVLIKQGDIEGAVSLFDRLIERDPKDLKVRGTATEAMLGAKRKDKALAYAEAGLAKAREQNNRDSEGYFLELVDAAQRG